MIAAPDEQSGRPGTRRSSDGRRTTSRLPSEGVRILHRQRTGTDEAPTQSLGVEVSGSIDTDVPVVLLHGMASDHTTWRSFARSLRRRGRSVVSVDMRGHGVSSREKRYGLDDFSGDVRFVLDELDLDTVDLAGHSLGAHTALRVAMDQPDRVRRLVLEEVPPMPRDKADLDEEIAVDSTLGERLRGLGQLIIDPRPFLRYDRSVTDQVNAEFAVAAPQWWSALEDVRARTLVISGGRRSFLPPHHLRTLSERLPDGSFEIIDAGHSVHRDQRARFAGLAGDFLSARV